MRSSSNSAFVPSQLLDLPVRLTVLERLNHEERHVKSIGKLKFPSVLVDFDSSEPVMPVPFSQLVRVDDIIPLIFEDKRFDNKTVNNGIDGKTQYTASYLFPTLYIVLYYLQHSLLKVKDGNFDCCNSIFFPLVSYLWADVLSLFTVDFPVHVEFAARLTYIFCRTLFIKILKGKIVTSNNLKPSLNEFKNSSTFKDVLGNMNLSVDQKPSDLDLRSVLLHEVGYMFSLAMIVLSANHVVSVSERKKTQEPPPLSSLLVPPSIDTPPPSSALSLFLPSDSVFSQVLPSHSLSLTDYSTAWPKSSAPENLFHFSSIFSVFLSFGLNLPSISTSSYFIPFFPVTTAFILLTNLTSLRSFAKLPCLHLPVINTTQAFVHALLNPG
jgi:hypothetical protein